MKYLFFVILIIFLIFLTELLYYYVLYKNSSYGKESGNSFLDTYFDRTSGFLKFNKGNLGEMLTFIELEKIKNYKRLLTNNYILDDDNLTHESDIIMINNTGIYVFESKNYSGWIFGNEANRYWTQSLYNEETHKKYKVKFYNLIWQNKKHVQEINKYLNNQYENRIYSYIVFSDRCELKRIKYSTSDCKLMKRNSLLKTLKYDLKNKENLYSNYEVDEIYDKLKRCSNVSDDVKQKHIMDIEYGAYFIKEKNNIIQEQLVNELKLYRKNKAELEHTRAYFIFTDETLNNLILNKPKTIEQLKKVKGMGNYNTHKYGDDILTIINKH